MQPGAGGFMGEYRPEGLGVWASRLKVFGKPLIVTENGLLEIEERERPAYLLRVLAGLHDAIQDGADVRGYFHWSLVDNFEWAEGYEARFGLVQINFDTQQRTVRPSGYLFRDIATANGITVDMAQGLAPEVVDQFHVSPAVYES
jgi:beta-glucosidase/6-phospho-beta-glucosidase/beta-galactosidase